MPRRRTDQILLTSRERDVLQHAAFGLNNRDIGDLLGIAEQTVKNHISSAMRKLAVHDRTHAVVFAIGEGLIGLPSSEPDRSEEFDVAAHVVALPPGIRRRT